MITAFYSGRHRLHAPAQGYEDERPAAYPEVPQRLDVTIAALSALAGVRLIEVGPASVPELLTVHSSVLVDGLREISESLGPGEVYQPWPGRDANFWVMSAPVTAGTYTAACHSAGCALAAAEAVRSGDPIAIALCRPPGHHAGRTTCGGFCYFNNAALAAQSLSLHGTVGVLDIDYHHGHGTQDIFYRRGDVAYASLHADTRHEYPYHFGRSHETGAGEGLGWNHNLPLPRDCGPDLYLATLDRALDWLKGKDPRGLVVSLGFDTCKLDPFGGLGLEPDSYGLVSRKIRALGRPMVIVFEGGYDLAALGPCWKSFIGGL